MSGIKFLDSQPSTPQSSKSEAGARVYPITVSISGLCSLLQVGYEQFTLEPPPTQCPQETTGARPLRCGLGFPKLNVRVVPLGEMWERYR
jgi:hypothetical protein